MDDDIKVGSIVRLFSSRSLAKVLEIDREYFAARCELMDGIGGEFWQKLDELEVVRWEKNQGKRISFRQVGAE
jgi:hypothetical protein